MSCLEQIRMRTCTEERPQKTLGREGSHPQAKEITRTRDKPTNTLISDTGTQNREKGKKKKRKSLLFKPPKLWYVVRTRQADSLIQGRKSVFRCPDEYRGPEGGREGIITDLRWFQMKTEDGRMTTEFHPIGKPHFMKK